jgi:hypothetical protein
MWEALPIQIICYRWGRVCGLRACIVVPKKVASSRPSSARPQFLERSCVDSLLSGQEINPRLPRKLLPWCFSRGCGSVLLPICSMMPLHSTSFWFGVRIVCRWSVCDTSLRASLCPFFGSHGTNDRKLSVIRKPIVSRLSSVMNAWTFCSLRSVMAVLVLPLRGKWAISMLPCLECFSLRRTVLPPP